MGQQNTEYDEICLKKSKNETAKGQKKIVEKVLKKFYKIFPTFKNHL